MAADVLTIDNTVRTGVPRRLFTMPPVLTPPEVDKDGKRFLFAAPEGSNTQTNIVLVLNWQGGLRK
jgi:hypothetical protein